MTTFLFFFLSFFSRTLWFKAAIVQQHRDPNLNCPLLMWLSLTERISEGRKKVGWFVWDKITLYARNKCQIHEPVSASLGNRVDKAWDIASLYIFQSIFKSRYCITKSSLWYKLFFSINKQMNLNQSSFRVYNKNRRFPFSYQITHHDETIMIDLVIKSMMKSTCIKKEKIIKPPLYLTKKE